MSVPSIPACHLETATERDVPLLMRFINELAAYEKLAHEVTATEADLHASLFGPNRVASAIIAYHSGEPAGYALYFFTFSTFLGKPGLFLEDLYVTPAQRRRHRPGAVSASGADRRGPRMRADGVGCARLE